MLDCKGKSGSASRTRTCDRAINSRLLYQLSYRGTAGDGGIARPAFRFKRQIAPTAENPLWQTSELWIAAPPRKHAPRKEKRRETSSRRRRWVMVGVSKRRHAQIRPEWLMAGKRFARNRTSAVQQDKLAAKWSDFLGKMLEAPPGIEPGCTDLQSAASPLRHRASGERPSSSA